MNNKKYQENLSGWERAILDNKINLKTSLHEDKLGSIKKLIESELPTYKYYFFNYEELESKIKNIYIEFKKIVVRACPKQNNVQRFTFINESIEEILDKINSNIQNVKDYIFVVNEYDCAECCGILIANKEELIIEIVNEHNLENLSHSKIIPFSARCSNNQQLTHNMNYLNEMPIKIKKIIIEVIEMIKSHNDIIEGYFEFVLSSKYKKIKFIDYRPKV